MCFHCVNYQLMHVCMNSITYVSIDRIYVCVYRKHCYGFWGNYWIHFTANYNMYVKTRLTYVIYMP